MKKYINVHIFLYKLKARLSNIHLILIKCNGTNTKWLHFTVCRACVFEIGAFLLFLRK